MADEILRRQVLYDDAARTPTASVAPRPRSCLTFTGHLEDAPRGRGVRSGWMVISGPRAHADAYLEGLAILATMRLCANTPGQYGIRRRAERTSDIDDLAPPPAGGCTSSGSVACELASPPSPASPA